MLSMIGLSVNSNQEQPSEVNTTKKDEIVSLFEFIDNPLYKLPLVPSDKVELEKYRTEFSNTGTMSNTSLEGLRKFKEGIRVDLVKIGRLNKLPTNNFKTWMNDSMETFAKNQSKPPKRSFLSKLKFFGGRSTRSKRRSMRRTRRSKRRT